MTYVRPNTPSTYQHVPLRFAIYFLFQESIFFVLNFTVFLFLSKKVFDEVVNKEGVSVLTLVEEMVGLV